MSDIYKVTYSPAALDDLESIYTYIAVQLKAEQTAKNQVNRIRKEIRSLDLFPERNVQVDWEPWKNLGMRILPVDNYVAYYSVDSENKLVTITRIFYGGRNVKTIVNSKLN